MVHISAVVITKNESEHIARCLDALKKAAIDDILVVDSMSTDDTVVICQKADVRVVQIEWKGYARTKNKANEMAEHDWILSIDADEVLSDELIQTIQNLSIREGQLYQLDRINNFCGQWIIHSGWYPDWKERLFDRRTTYWVGDYVHEKLKYPSQTPLIKLEGRLLHYSYQTLEDHWQRLEKYTQLSAEEMFHHKKSATWIKIWIAPFFRFFRSYILKLGFLDGKNGWIISKRNAALVHMKYKKLRSMYRQSP